MKGKFKINVNYETDDNPTVRIVKLDCGGLMNLGGRSLPF